MKLVKMSLGSLLFIIGSFCATSSMASSNFELDVLYEKGVKLEFFGFNKEGKQIFRAMSTEQVTNHGITYWVTRIDEDLVFDGEFVYFCVRDKRGKWSVPATLGKDAKELICDNNPTDTGEGKFIFLEH